MSEPEKDPIQEQTGSKSTKTVQDAPSKLPEPSPNVDLDTILKNEIGNFGKYQLLTFVIGIILVIFTALGSMNYVFTTALIPTRCLIPECESEPAVFAPPWVLNAIPSGAKTPFDYCQRYGHAARTGRKAGACPPSLFDRKKLLPCDKYVHQNTHSVVYDFGLECQEWKRTFIGTMRKLGTLTALPITSYMSDQYGRRFVISFNAFNSAWLGIIRYWIENYNTFVALEFIEATLASGLFSSVYLLVVELVGTKYRVAAGITINCSFATGQMLLGAIAWFVPNWRSLTLVLYIPQFTAIFCYCLIGQSVRWLMSKGRFEQAEAALKNMAKMNGRSISDSSLAGLRRTAQKELEEERQRALAQHVNEPGLFIQLWRHKRVLLRVLISPVWWITTTFIFYGLAISAVNMSGNKHFNFIAVAAVELPGFALAFMLLDRVGRKPVLAGGFWVCAVCQIGYILVPDEWVKVELAVTMLAKCAIAMVMAGIYVYTAELYPTSNRHKLLAFASMCGRVGSMIAPLTPAFAAQWFPDLPFVLFGSMAMLSGALIFLTPETLGTVLPSNFQQAQELGLQAKG